MRVLIATVTAGGGHLAAAAALEETWRRLRPDDVVAQVDLVDFFSPLHRKIHADGYLALIGKAPELWGMMFNKTDSLKSARRWHRWRRVFPGRSRVRFARHVTHFQPDAVLCTHYLPLETLALLRAGHFRKHKWSLDIHVRSREARRAGAAAAAPSLPARAPFVVSIVTDFEAHALWMESCVDLYCVAADHTKARLVARGAAAEDVVVTGIPVAMKFSGQPDVKAVRRTFGLRDDQPVLLVLSGGFGTGPLGGILTELNKFDRPLQTAVVTGRNEPLRRELAVGDWKHPTRVFGYMPNMHELMAVADLIITKAGGLTTSEALALGKPLLLVRPIPGQEAANSDFLLEWGAATKINRLEDLPYRLGQLLGARKLADMARAAKALGRPAAASSVCAEVVKRIAPAA
jgi:processive 1,2-diacylglycerol beta-glucosyltransferase